MLLLFRAFNAIECFSEVKINWQTWCARPALIFVTFYPISVGIFCHFSTTYGRKHNYLIWSSVMAPFYKQCNGFFLHKDYSKNGLWQSKELWWDIKRSYMSLCLRVSIFWGLLSTTCFSSTKRYVIDFRLPDTVMTFVFLQKLILTSQMVSWPPKMDQNGRFRPIFKGVLQFSQNVLRRFF